MSSTNKEGASAVEHDALSGARTSRIIVPKSNVASPKDVTPACLDRPAGRKAVAKRGTPQTNRNVSSKSGGSQGKPGKSNAKINGGAKHGQARDIEHHISVELMNYRKTEWYLKAIETGFKNAEALKRFNDTLRAFTNDIDPNKAPVCMDCGASDVVLCEHFITGRGIEIVSDALEIPENVISMRWRFTWVDKIRRMFTWSKYDSTLPLNHYIGDFTNYQIGDRLIWPEMLAYIRLNHNTSYEINGVVDRKAKLCHSKKLAVRFLDEMKIPLRDRCDASFVAQLQSTVQKSTDQGDDDMLLAPNSEVYNLPFLKALGSAKIPWKLLLVLAAIIAPTMTSRGAIAVLRANLYAWNRLAMVLGQIWGRGSVLIAKSVLRQTIRMRIVTAPNILSGMVRHCLKEIQRLLCRVVPTMLLKVWRSATLNQLQSLSQTIWTGVSFTAL